MEAIVFLCMSALMNMLCSFTRCSFYLPSQMSPYRAAAVQARVEEVYSHAGSAVGEIHTFLIRQVAMVDKSSES